MDKVWVLAGLLWTGAAAFGADSKGGGQDLLIAAEQRSALLERAPKPFVMDIDFTAKFDVPRTGHLRLRWQAKDRWWSKVTVGPYEAVWYQNGDKSYLLRNVQVTPDPIKDLYALIHVGRSYRKEIAHNAKERMRDGARVTCVESHVKDRPEDRDEICLNAGASVPVAETHRSADETWVSRFSDYAEIEGFQYPRRLEVVKNGKSELSATVVELKEEALDPGLLAPVEGAIVRRECEDKTPPKELQNSAPEVGGAAIRGADKMLVTVMEDGKVGDVQVLVSGGKAFDDAVRKALRQVRFRPAMCGKEAVVDDIEWTVSIN